MSKASAWCPLHPRWPDYISRVKPRNQYSLEHLLGSCHKNDSTPTTTSMPCLHPALWMVHCVQLKPMCCCSHITGKDTTTKRPWCRRQTMMGENKEWQNSRCEGQITWLQSSCEKCPLCVLCILKVNSSQWMTAPDSGKCIAYSEQRTHTQGEITSELLYSNI